MKRKLLIGGVVSAFFLFLALRDVDWPAFRAAFRSVDYGYLALCVVFTMLGHFARSIRWRYMLLTVKRIRIGSLWSATAIAFMVNNLFPARLGEFVRAYAIGRSESISKSAAFATIVYERIIDVFILIVLLWYCLLKIEGPPWLRSSGVVLIVFNVALLTLLYVMVRYRQGFAAALARVCSPLRARARTRVMGWEESFVAGLGVLRDRSALLPIIVYSVPVWGFATLGVYYCLLAINMQQPFLASIILIVVMSLGSMIPSAPAYIGTIQYACIVGLAIYGVDHSSALAYSTMYHATQFFPITLVGLYYAWRSSIRLSEISKKTA